MKLIASMLHENQSTWSQYREIRQPVLNVILLLLLHMTPSRSNSQAEVLLRKTFQQTTQNKTTRLEIKVWDMKLNQGPS